MFATPSQKGSSKLLTLPAPTGGLNARDSLVDMPPTDAIKLENFWIQPYGLGVRRGYQVYATLPETPYRVESLLTWTGGSNKLFAFAGTKMYDVTYGGVVTTPLLTGLTTTTWTAVGMGNAAGQHLICVNGFDDAIVYNDTGVHRISAGDGVTAYTWKNVDPKTVVSVTVYQHRIWATVKDSSKAYYLPLDALYGVANGFDFGPLMPRSGPLRYIATWTLDAGDGATDHLVAVSASGFAIVYKGIDPTSSATWQLVGVFDIGIPVGLFNKGSVKVGGDLLILTMQGLISMSALLISADVKQGTSTVVTSKIQQLFTEHLRKIGNGYFWELSSIPQENMLLCNAPQLGDANMQYVFNRVNNAWATLKGLDAITWGALQSEVFFGSRVGTVCKAFTGNKDNVALDGTGGTGIVASCQQAYSYLDSPGAQKQVGMYRVNFAQSNKLGFNSKVTYDFESGALVIPDSPTPSPEKGVWDSSVWDSSVWDESKQLKRSWIQAQGIGVSVALSLTVTAASETLWISTDFSYVSGGTL